MFEAQPSVGQQPENTQPQQRPHGLFSLPNFAPQPKMPSFSNLPPLGTYQHFGRYYFEKNVTSYMCKIK